MESIKKKSDESTQNCGDTPLDSISFKSHYAPPLMYVVNVDI